MTNPSRHYSCKESRQNEEPNSSFLLSYPMFSPSIVVMSAGRGEISHCHSPSSHYLPLPFFLCPTLIYHTNNAVTARVFAESTCLTLLGLSRLTIRLFISRALSTVRIAREHVEWRYVCVCTVPLRSFWHWARFKFSLTVFSKSFHQMTIIKAVNQSLLLLLIRIRAFFALAPGMKHDRY